MKEPDINSPAHSLEELIKLRNPSLDDGEIRDFMNIIRARLEHARDVIMQNEGESAFTTEEWEKFRESFQRLKAKELGL